MSSNKMVNVPLDCALFEAMIYSINSMSDQLERAFDLTQDGVFNYYPDKKPSENALMWVYKNYDSIGAGLRMITNASSVIAAAIENASIAIVPNEPKED